MQVPKAMAAGDPWGWLVKDLKGWCMTATRVMDDHLFIQEGVRAINDAHGQQQGGQAPPDGNKHAATAPAVRGPLHGGRARRRVCCVFLGVVWVLWVRGRMGACVYLHGIK